ncbi:MAG: DUF2953 domain-containing protein [Acetobacter sp.]|nr:DUF2953 domain-containing protein [Bacteroides sp.]MCM1342028.1 DUF2953 domain-containing protein [Acetobacter sp.]MCM1434244.1 DUF2953 domain-containing protein [Clostridiales bacterium]
MKIFLIIVAVLAVLIFALMRMSATITLIYDKGWTTRLGVLFIEKDIELSKILSFLLFPEKKAHEVAEADKNKGKAKNKSKKRSDEPAEVKEPSDKTAENIKKEDEKVINEITFDNPNEAQVVKIIEGEDGPTAVFVSKKNENESKQVEKKAPAKKNPIAKLWDDEGIVGMLSLVSNLIETANSAILTIFRGLHIYSLYVMIIVGGGDAASIAQSYGRLCKNYYPLKGIILNGMKVDNYDDYIQPDFIAPSTEFEMQFIASISVGLIVKMALKAIFVFLKNLIKDKKSK